jgi:hypothetical protein
MDPNSRQIISSAGRLTTECTRTVPLRGPAGDPER